METASWRDKIFSLGLWAVIILLLFRPLLWNDWLTIKAATPETLSHCWQVMGMDLFCTGFVFTVVYWLILGRIGFIALNTFREAVRNRILYFILFFAIVLMMASGVVKELAISAQTRLVTDLGLASISFFGLMAAVFAGISLVYNELERKTIYTIVSKPVHRYQFLLGKYFGLLLTIYVIIGIMTLFFFLVFNYQANTSDEVLEKVLYAANASGQMEMVQHPGLTKSVFLIKAAGLSLVQSIGNMFGFSTGAVSPVLLVAIAMIALRLMIVTAIAVFFSSFSTPALSAVFTVMLFLAGTLNEDIVRFGLHITETAVKEFGIDNIPVGVHIKVALTNFAACVIPNLDKLDVTSEVVHGEKVNVWRVAVLYAFCYTGAVLLGAILIFRKRNFK
jgi:ABC-type transport system involved in multi-copper enzyme maturation permease subunit